MSRAHAVRRTVVLVLMAVLSAGLVMATSAAREGLGIGDQPPDFVARDLQGHEHSLAAYRGQVVLLHFWATWCPYCRREIPKLIAIHEEWATKDVVVLAVSVDNDLEQLDRFVAQKALPYAVIPEAATDGALSFQYRVRGVPTTYIMGADGRILNRFGGVSDLVEAVRQAVQGADS